MVPEKKTKQAKKQTKGKRSYHYGKMTGSDSAIHRQIQRVRRVQAIV